MKKINTNKYFDLHRTIKGKKRFIHKQIVAFFLFFGCLITDSFLFYVVCSFNSNSVLKNILLTLGIILLFLILAAYLLFNIIQVKFFYKSQELFSKTKEFDNLKKKVLANINKANKQELKEYCQLHLIDKKTMQDYLSKNKNH